MIEEMLTDLHLDDDTEGDDDEEESEGGDNE